MRGKSTPIRIDLYGDQLARLTELAARTGVERATAAKRLFVIGLDGLKSENDQGDETDPRVDLALSVLDALEPLAVHLGADVGDLVTEMLADYEANPASPVQVALRRGLEKRLKGLRKRRS